MANPTEMVPQRGLAYAAGQRVGQGITRTKTAVNQRLSQTGAMLKERQSEAQQNVGARSVRGRFAGTGSQSTPKNGRELADAAQKMVVKGGPVLFWLVAGCAVVKDIIDIVSALLDAIGLGLTATVVGGVVGVPLAVFSEILDKASGLFIDFTVVAYFGYIGGGFALRLVTLSIGAVIDAIPGLNVLPLTTVSFFAAYLLGRTVQKATQSSLIANTAKVARVGMAVANTAGSTAMRVGRIATRLAR